MNARLRKIEIDVETAEALEAQATARGLSLQELLADLARMNRDVPVELETMRSSGRGPWAPEVLAEDTRRLADYERTGEGVPWAEVLTWMQSWGSSQELPPPKPRKL